MSGPKNAAGNLAAIRKAFQAEEQKRDEDFESRVARLLKNIDDFDKGADDAGPSE